MLAEERSLRTAVLARLEGEQDLRPLATPVDAALGALHLASRMAEAP
jgi:hypothetical protein